MILRAVRRRVSVALFPPTKIMLGRHVSSSSLAPLRSSTTLKTRSASSICVSSRPKSSLVSPRSRHQPPPPCRTPITTVASRKFSNLGLRTNQPPDSLPDPTPESPEIPDQEWEIRTGRAIYVLQETLPEFFKTGLITSINKVTGSPRSSSSAPTPTVNPNFLEPHILPEDEEPIYSPNIRLSYTPPVELPPPFPKTFHVEGFQLYLASSSLIRHTMLALYSDLAVRNTKLVINTPPARQPEPSPPSPSRKRRMNREKSILLRQTVTGVARVSGKPGEWLIESTYTFSPVTGLIHQHIINSIHPAPHQAVYDTLRLSMSKLLGDPGPSPTNGAACKGKIESQKSGQ